MSRDKEMGDATYLMNNRDGETKPFSFRNETLKPKSTRMLYEEDPKFNDAQALYANC